MDQRRDIRAGSDGRRVLCNVGVSEIYKRYLNQGKSQPPLYFYRDSNKKEIDLIIYQDGVVSPIEIKKFCAKGCRKEFQRAESY